MPVDQVTRTGITQSAAVTLDSTGNVVIQNNDGNVLLEVINTDGSAAHDVSVVATASLAGQTLGATVVTIPAGATRWIGPWPPVVYNDSLGQVAVKGDTHLTARGLRI